MFLLYDIQSLLSAEDGMYCEAMQDSWCFKGNNPYVDAK